MPPNNTLRPHPLPPFSARQFFHVPNLLLPPPPPPSQQPPQVSSTTPTAPHTPAPPSALPMSPEAIARVQEWEKDVEMQNLDERTRRLHVEEGRTPPTKTPSPPADREAPRRIRCACLEGRGGGEGGGRSEKGGAGGDGDERIEQRRRQKDDQTREMTSRTQAEAGCYKKWREEHSQVLEEEEEEGGSVQRDLRQNGLEGREDGAGDEIDRRWPVAGRSGGISDDEGGGRRRLWHAGRRRLWSHPS